MTAYRLRFQWTFMKLILNLQAKEIKRAERTCCNVEKSAKSAKCVKCHLCGNLTLKYQL